MISSAQSEYRSLHLRGPVRSHSPARKAVKLVLQRLPIANPQIGIELVDENRVTVFVILNSVIVDDACSMQVRRITVDNPDLDIRQGAPRKSLRVVVVLVERDIDFLREMVNNRLVSVYISITTLDAELARKLELPAAACKPCGCWPKPESRHRCWLHR